MASYRLLFLLTVIFSKRIPSSYKKMLKHLRFQYEYNINIVALHQKDLVLCKDKHFINTQYSQYIYIYICVCVCVCVGVLKVII